MPAMDDAMAALATAVEAAIAKAVDDYKAANPPVDESAAMATQEATDAATVQAYAATINPPA